MRKRVESSESFPRWRGALLGGGLLLASALGAGCSTSHKEVSIVGPFVRAVEVRDAALVKEQCNLEYVEQTDTTYISFWDVLSTTSSIDLANSGGSSSLGGYSKETTETMAVRDCRVDAVSLGVQP